MPPTKLTDVTPEHIQEIVKTVNNQYYQILDLESVCRKLENRMDTLVPTTMNMTVVPNSKLILGVTLVAAAIGGYVAYVEVRRTRKETTN